MLQNSRGTCNQLNQNLGMNITVAIPTYRRPHDLIRCLEALKRQTRLADEVLIILRSTDTDTWAQLNQFTPAPLKLQTIVVAVPGTVAALNAAIDAAKGDIVAFTDDDAIPHIDWLARIEAHFLSNDDLGGVGGKDWIYVQGKLLCDRTYKTVGKLQWFGRLIGNHHVGVGAPREVDFLKGVNMSFRRSAIAHLHFDERLQGTGAQVHNEIGFCLALRRAGWVLVYDPAVAVDHYLGQRFGEDQRYFKFNTDAFSNTVHNETLALLEHMTLTKRIIFIGWAILIGTRSALGLMQWLRLLFNQDSLATQKYLSSLRGRWQGWQTWKQSNVKHQRRSQLEIK